MVYESALGVLWEQNEAQTFAETADCEVLIDPSLRLSPHIGPWVWSPPLSRCCPTCLDNDLVGFAALRDLRGGEEGVDVSVRLSSPMFSHNAPSTHPPSISMLLSTVDALEDC